MHYSFKIAFESILSLSIASLIIISECLKVQKVNSQTSMSISMMGIEKNVITLEKA